MSHHHHHKGGEKLTWRCLLIALSILFFIGCGFATSILAPNYAKYAKNKFLALGLSETRLMDVNDRRYDTMIASNFSLSFAHQYYPTSKPFVTIMKFHELPPTTITHMNYVYNNDTLPDGYYRYGSMFLKAGSQWNISWFFSDYVTFQMLSSYEYKQMKAGYRHYYLASRYSAYGSYSFNPDEDDFYTAIISNDNGYPVEGFYEYSANTITYDVSNPKESCMVPCSMKFDKGEHIIFVTPDFYNFTSQNHSADWQFTMNVRGNLRLSNLLSIFVPLSIGAIIVPIIFISIVIYDKYCKNRSYQTLGTHTRDM